MQWRIDHQYAYEDQSLITEETYRKWLEEHVFSQFRFFWFVVGDEGEKIGHMGLYRFNAPGAERVCEVDNVLRGRSTHPGYMSLALQRMIQWAYETLPIDTICLRVKKGNDHARNFYYKNGFFDDGEDSIYWSLTHEHSL